MKTSLVISFVVIAVLSALLLFKGCGSKQTVNDALQQHKYDSLQSENFRKNDSLISLRIREQQLQKAADSLIKLITTNEKSRDTLWLSKPVKDAVIKSYSVQQLESKLAERFGY